MGEPVVKDCCRYPLRRFCVDSAALHGSRSAQKGKGLRLVQKNTAFEI